MCIISDTVNMDIFSQAPLCGHYDYSKKFFAFLLYYTKSGFIHTFLTIVSKVIKRLIGYKFIPHSKKRFQKICPRQKVKPVMEITFVYSNLMHDVVTRSSCAIIFHLLNKAHIECFSKNQSTVKTATCGY